MDDQLKHMTGQVAKGTMTRREFVGRAAALGVTAAVANSMLANHAQAAAHEAPIRGGTLKIGSSPRYIPKLMLSKKHYINLFTSYETDYLPSFTSSLNE